MGTPREGLRAGQVFTEQDRGVLPFGQMAWLPQHTRQPSALTRAKPEPKENVFFSILRRTRSMAICSYWGCGQGVPHTPKVPEGLTLGTLQWHPTELTASVQNKDPHLSNQDSIHPPFHKTGVYSTFRREKMLPSTKVKLFKSLNT